VGSRPLVQKTIGVLGGGSNVATAEYYRLLNQIANDRLGGWDIAETMIAGMNFGNIEAMVRDGDWTGLETYMGEKVDGLMVAGADVLICVSNTLHKPLLPIVARRTVPFIHIADPTGAAIKAAGLARVALFGTKATMALLENRRRYEEEFGLEIVVPDEREQDEIDRIIFDELTRDRILPASKARYLEIADRLAAEAGAEGLILGCTEIFLLIDQADRPALPMFNTTALHCQAAVEFALGARETV